MNNFIIRVTTIIVIVLSAIHVVTALILDNDLAFVSYLIPILLSYPILKKYKDPFKNPEPEQHDRHLTNCLCFIVQLTMVIMLAYAAHLENYVAVTGFLTSFLVIIDLYE